ncbi:ATP-binding protein [Archangium sp.]|uniref:ATP-binding protein n=1 Tax=Archangium sp. TaxID=1872627 RepID=UPI002D3FEEF8|nr:ATP-binding protein [Archangium sp.]HYO51869.1 ATP-binding protein [Archangium sp.]
MSAQPKRIFIVEDQRLIAADLENTLRKLSYHVVGNATTGEEAIEKVSTSHPDLVLMDIRLRGDMDGIQAAGAIRQRLDIPIVYLTAYADEETILRAKETSPFGYVVKPFNERELRAAIEIAIYKHETDRLLTEERTRRQAAEEFRLIVDSVRDYAIFRMDAEGRITTWNVGAEQIKGYRSEEVLGKHFSIFYTPEDAKAGKPESDLRLAAAEGSIEDEGWRVRKDGSRFWANTVITALRDEKGRLLGFGKVTRDDSDRKRREDVQRFLDHATMTLTSTLELQETLDRVTRLAVPDLAEWCLLDLPNETGHLVQVATAHVEPEKEELARRLGRGLPSRVDLQHGARHVFRTGKSEIHPQLDDPLVAAGMLGIEYPELLRELGVLSYICVPIQFRGKTQGVLNLLRSASARRYTSSDLAVAEDLARRASLAIDNARMFQETQEAIRVRDEFLQIASHELKTPLTPLQLQLDTLAHAFEKSGVQNERLSARLETATRQTARLSRLVESLLDVSRITAGQLLLQPEEFDFSEMVRDVVERFQAEARNAGCEISVGGETALVGRWDRLRLEQVVSNLLSNALKYGARKPVEVEARASDGMVRLAVTDHGIGINKEALGRIFGRFERAVSLRHFGGLGLGLFIAKQIAEAHGGSIVVQSQPGHGTTFTVVLPLLSSVRKAASKALDMESEL